MNIYAKRLAKKLKIPLLGLLFCALCYATFLLTACREAKFEEMKSMPMIEESQYSSYKVYTRQDFGYYFNYQKSFNSVQTKVPKNIQFLMLDGSFREVDYFFFRKFNNWFKRVKFENGIMAIDQKENLDCDNFAMLYKSFMGVANYKSNLNQEPAVALVIVEQKHPFGGVPTGSLHMLNLVFASNGWYIFEPQTGEYIELHKYPNQEYIRIIII